MCKVCEALSNTAAIAMRSLDLICTVGEMSKEEIRF